jgi:putative endonuclease
MQNFYVYMMASTYQRLYVGVTNDLLRRVAEHKSPQNIGFTGRYNIQKLVRYEEFIDIRVAIEREKQIKNMPRARKLKLVERENPTWEDLELA